MDPLIEIKTVPIEIQMKVTRAHLEFARGTAQLEISRDKGGLSIRSQPIRVNIDTFESRNSVMPTTATVIRQQAQAGKQSAYQATAVLAQEGRMMMEARIDQVEAILTLVSAQTSYNAALQVGANVVPQSLMDYLS